MKPAILALILQALSSPTGEPPRPFHPAEAPGELDERVQAWIDAEGEACLPRVDELARSSDPDESAAGARGLLRFARRALEAGDCPEAARLARAAQGPSLAPPGRLEALRLLAASAPAEEVARRLEAIRSGRRDASLRPWLAELEALAAKPRCASVDVGVLLERVRALQRRDLSRWTEWRFRREVLRQRLDERGGVKSSERLLFEIEPRAGGFDERLIRLDGKKPPREELLRHREAGRFEKHWRSLLGAGVDEEAEGRFSPSQLLEMSGYLDRGIVEVEGRPCRRLDFRPEPERGGGDGLAGRLADAMEGSLFVSVRGSRVVKAEARTVRPVGAYGGLAGVRALEVEMVQAPVAEDQWLPERIEVRTRVRVLFGVQRKRNVYSYSLFSPAGSSQ